MSPVYRLFGAVALLNQRLSRFRINLIPINWAVMFGLGVLLVTALGETHDATVNGAKPRAVSVADVLDHHDMDHNYVTVQGLVVPGDGYSEKDDGTVEHTWVPLVDVKGKRAFLVEMDDPGGNPRPVTETGMLRSMDSDLVSQVQKDGGSIEGIPIDTDYTLVMGEHPGSAAGWGTVAAGSALLLAVFVITFLQRYVVFQKVSPRYAGLSADTPPTPEQAIDLRVTGEFSLDPRNTQRFLNVPAGITALENGEIAFVSNIDASRRFMGITTSKRAGLWAAIIQPGTLSNPEHGVLYVGIAARPALRIQYTDASTKRRAGTILSFATEGQRDIVLRDLEATRRPGIPA